MAAVSRDLTVTRRPRAPLALLVAWLAFYLLTASGRITPGDEETMFRVTESLATRARVDIDREQTAIPVLPDGPGLLPSRDGPISSAIATTFAVPGADGRLYAWYGIGQSLVTLPLWVFGRLLALLVPALGEAYATRFAASLLAPLVSAAAAWLVADAALALDHRRGTALALSATYGLATMAWPYAKSWFSEPALALLVLLAFDEALRARQGEPAAVWRSAAALALALLFKFSTVLWWPAFALAAAWPAAGRRARLAALLVACALAVALTGAYNAARFGSPLVFGYDETTAWDQPLVAGLIGLLASPGKGLFLYNPPLLLGLGGLLLWLAPAGRRGLPAAVIGLLALPAIAFFATYSYWTGGWNWGPRFLLPLVPLLLLPAGALLEAAQRPTVRVAWVALLAAGLLVNLPAILVEHSRYLVAASEQDPDFYRHTIWEPGASPVAQQWAMVAEVGALWAEQRGDLERGLRRFGADRIGVVQREEFLRWNAPDFWPVHWALLGYPLWLPIAGSAGALLALGGSLARLLAPGAGEPAPARATGAG
jgi:hypothetical protein